MTSSYGTIKVNIDALATMLHALNHIQVDLGVQSENFMTLSSNIGTVLSGSAVQTFETNFTSWATKLNDLAEDIQATYSVLDTLLLDLEMQTARLNSIHFIN